VTSTVGIDLARLTDGDKASRARAGASGRAGQIADGLVMIEEANARSERTEECWQMAELLRIKGELLLMQGAPGSRGDGRGSLPAGARLGAPARRSVLGLRAATSLARLLRDQGRSADALALLQPVYDRFTEGFETTDLNTANALLDALQ
jgi:predicted ATPase